MTENEQPGMDEILDWLEGRLPDEEAGAIAARLEAGGQEAAERVDWARSFLDTAAESRRTTPPGFVRKTLIERFKDHASGRETPGLLQQILAALSFDSSARLSYAGARTAPSIGKQRQLIYETEIAEIALNIQPEKDATFTITGQVFPRSDLPASGWSIQALSPVDGAETALVASDEAGEFRLEALPDGRCAILLSGEDVEISIPEIRLQR